MPAFLSIVMHTALLAASFPGPVPSSAQTRPRTASTWYPRAFIDFAEHGDGVLISNPSGTPDNTAILYLHDGATIHYDTHTSRLRMLMRDGTALEGWLEHTVIEGPAGDPVAVVHAELRAGEVRVDFNAEFTGPGPAFGDYCGAVTVRESGGPPWVIRVDSHDDVRSWTPAPGDRTVAGLSRSWIADFLCAVISLFGGTCPCQPSCQDICCPQWWECLVFGPQQCGCPGSGEICREVCTGCGSGG